MERCPAANDASPFGQSTQLVHREHMRRAGAIHRETWIALSPDGEVCAVANTQTELKEKLAQTGNYCHYLPNLEPLKHPHDLWGPEQAQWNLDYERELALPPSERTVRCQQCHAPANAS